MGFFDFLKSKTSVDWKKTLIKDLVMLTAIDGEMDEDEIKELLNIAVNQLGFSESEFIKLLNNLGNVADIYPTTSDKKLEYMLCLIRMTYSDGYVDDNEIAYMEIVASKMGLPKEGVQKVMQIIENEILDDTKTKNESYHNDYSVNRIIITPVHGTTVDVQSEEGVQKYFLNISKLSHLDLCIEFNNVLAAKFNLMQFPSSIENFSKNQSLVTDLTDKALIICFLQFGQKKVLDYCNQDTRIFNKLVNEIDSKYSYSKNLTPAEYGDAVFKDIQKILG